MTCGGAVASSARDTVAKLKARALRIAPATNVRRGAVVIVFMVVSLEVLIKPLGLLDRSSRGGLWVRCRGVPAGPIRCLTHTDTFRVPNPTFGSQIE
jgi:hypothetical protein